jgi:hypothetical protein
VKLAVAHKLRREWQPLLGLAGWDIKVRWAKAVDFEEGSIDQDCAGSIMWQTEYKSATLLLNKAHIEDYHEMDTTLVHELLHLLLEGNRPHTGKYDPLYEHALNVIAEQLVTSAAGSVDG